MFSLEMAKEQLVSRLLCMVGQVDSAPAVGFWRERSFEAAARGDQAQEANLHRRHPNISVLSSVPGAKHASQLI